MLAVLTRKWRTFLDDPVAAVRHTLRRAHEPPTRMYRRSWNRRSKRAAERRLERLGVLAVLNEFVQGRPRKAYRPDFRDLLYLYEQVRRRQPRVILEFGSGCSTVVMAQAVWDNARESQLRAGRLYSVDGQRFWANATLEAMPAHLATICEVTFSPVAEVEEEGVKGLRQAQVPDVHPDFVYLDGPDPPTRRETPKGGPLNFDILDLEPRFWVGFAMVVDGRRNTVALLRRRLTGTYGVTPRPRFNNTLFELAEPRRGVPSLASFRSRPVRSRIAQAAEFSAWIALAASVALVAAFDAITEAIEDHNNFGDVDHLVEAAGWLTLAGWAAVRGFSLLPSPHPRVRRWFVIALLLAACPYPAIVQDDSGYAVNGFLLAVAFLLLGWWAVPRLPRRGCQQPGADVRGRRQSRR